MGQSMHERTVLRTNGPERSTMNTHDKLVAAARRAARRHAREQGRPYQHSLETVARTAGRPTWKAFLNDPVPVDEDSRQVTLEPDFSALPPEDHLKAAFDHGRRIDAYALVASPRAWDDPRPVLTYRCWERWEEGMEAGRYFDRISVGVDARGLDLAAIATGVSGRSHHVRDGGCSEARVIAQVSGRLVSANVKAFEMGGTVTAITSVSMTLSDPEPTERLRPPAIDEEPAVPPETGLRGRMRRRIRTLMGGDQRDAIRRMVDHGPLSRTTGPIIGYAGPSVIDIRKGGGMMQPPALRLRPGHSLMSFSPPGTGRLAGVAIPALLSDDVSSYLVHDDGQTHEITSGWRAEIGRVATIRLEGDSTDAFNPLDAAWLPDDGMVAGRVAEVMRVVSGNNETLAAIMTDAAMALIEPGGGTTFRDVHEALAARRDDRLARLAADMLADLATRRMDAAFGRNTITPADLRGRGTQGNRPLTIYLIRGRQAEPHDVMLAVIQAVIWRWTVSYGPGDDLPGGEVNGPCGFVSLLTDLHRLPVMHGMARALDLQRAKKTSMIITSAAGSAIEERYGKDDALLIRQCCGVRLAAPQSDPGDMPFVDPYDQVGYGALSMLPQDEGYVFTQRDIPPVRIRRAWFFTNPALLQRAFNHRTRKGPRPVG